MISIHRVKAITLRHLLITFRLFQRIIDLLFWPFINFLLWGFSSLSQHNEQQTITLLICILLWQILFRINLEICQSLVDEITSFNLTNLFATPLKLYEWIVGVMALGIIKACFTFLFGAFCIWLLYSINILILGFYYIPFIILAILNGWFIGFIAASCIILWGHSVRELVWVVPWIFVPLSSIFYSINILPSWLQTIAWFIPQPYLFESLRSFVVTGTLPFSFYMPGIAITLLYSISAILLFKISFEKSRNLGLFRLENS